MSEDEKPPCSLSETNSAPDIASAVANGNSRKIELPKLLVDNCNYEQLKKLSFQKLNDLTKSSAQLIGSSTGSNSELNKSKSLNNLALAENSQPPDDGQLNSIENLKKGELCRIGNIK